MRKVWEECFLNYIFIKIGKLNFLIVFVICYIDMGIYKILIDKCFKENLLVDIDNVRFVIILLIDGFISL